MTTLTLHTRLLTGRSLHALWRQPAVLVVTLIQPMIWLLLFGELFQKVVDIPGFDSGGASYIAFLTPGVVAMTALFSAAWAGTTFIEDMNLGVMDRMLSSPVRRSAMIGGTVTYQGVTAVVQTVVVLLVAYTAGARFGAPVTGTLLTVAAAVLLTVAFSALSNAVALLVRQQEALIGISQMLSLPLTFLSSAIIASDLMPAWMQGVARYNPLDWAVLVSREGLSSSADWSIIWSRGGALAALALVMTWLATRAFRVYQHSL